MESQSHNKSTPKIVGSVAIVAIVAVAFLVLIIKPMAESKSSDNSPIVSQVQTDNNATQTQPISSEAETKPVTTTDSASQTPVAQTPDPTPASNNLQTLTGSTTYNVPEGNTNGIDVEIKLNNGVITAVVVDHTYTDSESKEYMDKFDDGIEGYVEGKALKDVKATVINGASVTSAAFFNVLQSL